MADNSIAHFGTMPVKHPRHQFVGFAVEVINGGQLLVSCSRSNIESAVEQRQIKLLLNGNKKSLGEISVQHAHAMTQSHLPGATGDEEQSSGTFPVVLDDLHSADPDQAKALRALSSRMSMK